MIEGTTHMAVILSCQGRMCNAFNFRKYVSLLAGNVYALPSQGNMAFKLPSFGLLERTKRSSALKDFPQFSRNDLTYKEEIRRGFSGFVFTAKRSDGESVIMKKLLRQHKHKTCCILKGNSNTEIVALQKYCQKNDNCLSFGFVSQTTVSHSVIYH